MSGCGAKNTISELVLAAVFYLQQKNGVSVMEVAEYIGEKNCCDPCKISRQIKVALNKAKEHGIMSESKGKYRIEGKYEDKLEKDELKPPKNDDEDEGNDKGNDDDCGGSGFDDEQGNNNGEGEDGAKDEKCEDSLMNPALVDEDDEEMDEDDYRERDLGEPVSKRRKMYLKTRDIYKGHYAEDDGDDDSDTCILNELRDLERMK